LAPGKLRKTKRPRRKILFRSCAISVVATSETVGRHQVSHIDAHHKTIKAVSSIPHNTRRRTILVTYRKTWLCLAQYQSHDEATHEPASVYAPVYCPSAITWSSNVSKMYTPMVEIICQLRTSEHGGGKALNEALEGTCCYHNSQIRISRSIFCKMYVQKATSSFKLVASKNSQHDFCPRFGSTSTAV
jgi:hypothetical protein